MYFRKSERVVLEELKKYMKRTEEGIRIQMVTKRIRVYGIVQGVGFRPTVSRHAATAGITGSVCNKGPYVEIFAQGEEKCVKDFLERLEKKPPKRAAILKINVEDLKEAGTGERCEENGREKNIPEMDDNKAAENVIKKKIEEGYKAERKYLKEANEDAIKELKKKGVKFWDIDMDELKNAYEAEAKKKGFTFDSEWQKAVNQVIADTK